MVVKESHQRIAGNASMRSDGVLQTALLHRNQVQFEEIDRNPAAPRTRRPETESQRAFGQGGPRH